MPLIMPYYMDYDLMLFAIPAVLQSADWIRTPGPKSRMIVGFCLPGRAFSSNSI